MDESDRVILCCMQTTLLEQVRQVPGIICSRETEGPEPREGLPMKLASLAASSLRSPTLQVQAPEEQM